MEKNRLHSKTTGAPKSRYIHYSPVKEINTSLDTTKRSCSDYTYTLASSLERFTWFGHTEPSLSDEITDVDEKNRTYISRICVRQIYGIRRAQISAPSLGGEAHFYLERDLNPSHKRYFETRMSHDIEELATPLSLVRMDTAGEKPNRVVSTIAQQPCRRAEGRIKSA
jgi:hypothetical protein